MAINKPDASNDPQPEPHKPFMERSVGTSQPAEDDYSLDLRELPDGRYVAEVEEITLSVGRESKQPYFNVKFRLLEPEEYLGHNIWAILSFAPRARSWTVQRLTAIAGHELPQERINIADPAFQAQFIRRRVILRIEASVDLYGTLVPEVAAIYPAPTQ